MGQCTRTDEVKCSEAIALCRVNSASGKLDSTTDYLSFSLFFSVSQWRFGLVRNVVGRINEVNERRDRLVLGWVIVGELVYGERTRCVAVIQVNSALPSPCAVSTSDSSWGVNRLTARYTGSVNWCLAYS